MYILREASEHIVANVTSASLKYLNIIAVVFIVISSNVRLFIGFPYIRFNLKKLLYVYIKIDESQI